MRVKKFEAKSMKEALQMVKYELGPDAVILGARDNRKFGLAGEASVEVTAAVSESTLHKKKFTESRLTAGDREKFANSDARTQRQVIERMVENRQKQNTVIENELRPRRTMTTTSYIDIEDEDQYPVPRPGRSANQRAPVKRVSDLLSQLDLGGPSRPARRQVAEEYSAPYEEPVPSGPRTSAKARIHAAAREAWRASPFFDEPKNESRKEPAPPVQADPTSPRPASTAQSEIVSLKGEISRLEKMLEGFQKVPQSFSLSAMHPGAEFGIPYDFSFMFQKLTEAGVTVDNSVDILTQAAKEIDPVQAKKRSMIDAWVARWLLNSIQVVSHPFQGRMQLFVGGAGSGKTSSLVKIASHLVVREKKRVAVLSTDSFKVGAVDQMKIYCQILNVPFAVIRNRNDWEWVMGQLPHVDHVLVDMPGFQLRDLDELHLMKSLLPPENVAPVTHFCVSATSKDGDAYEVAKRYRITNYSDLIVTNLDQSVQHGLIHNLQKKTGCPLHSFGIGNRIPEDFEVASKERVLDLIFKLTKLKR